MTEILPADPAGSATSTTPTLSTAGQLSLFSSPASLALAGRASVGESSPVSTGEPPDPGPGPDEPDPSPKPDAPPASRRNLRPQAAPRQARLPRPDDLTLHERALGAALRIYLPPGKGLELTLTDNHYSMISVRRKSDGYTLRLHRMFVGAQPRIVRALARYVVHNDRRASQVLGDYIEGHQHIINKQARKVRQLNVRTAGRHHDLKAIYDRLNADRFGSSLDARITWGPVANRRARRSIKMGSFAVEDKIIRIHPVLDQADVPEFFVAWIVFHEMLHGKHDIVRKGRRRIFHSQPFMAEERRYPDYERATAWERANLDRLLGG